MTLFRRRKRKPIDRRDFTIGIMSALDIESDQISKVFDERWTTEDTGFSYEEGDPIVHAVGTIAKHNAIAVRCSSNGERNAAQVGEWLKARFPEMGVIIAVGICGAVPFYKHEQSSEQIWLGDCIFSTAVVRLNLECKGCHGFRVTSGLDGRGRPRLSTNRIMAKFWPPKNRLALTESLRSHLLALQLEDPDCPSHPGTEHDQLQQRCADRACTSQYHVRRTRPEMDDSPNIHFGCFGSSNPVVDTGIDRDHFAKTHGVIAFETETSDASDVSDVCQIIAIKAACSYADGHNNDLWQRYAATVAAAGLKAFLSLADLSNEDLFNEDQRSIVRMASTEVPFSHLRNKEDLSDYGHGTATTSPNFEVFAYGPEKLRSERNSAIYVHNLQNGTVMHEITVEEDTQVRSLAFNYKGDMLASSHGGYWYTGKRKRDVAQCLPVSIRLWDLQTGKLRWTCRAHSRKSLSPPLITMCFDPTGSQLAVTYQSMDEQNAGRPSFFVIETNKGEVMPLQVSTVPPGARLGQFSPDGERLFLHLEKEVALLNSNDYSRIFFESSISISDGDAATFSPDGSLLVIDQNGYINTHYQDAVIEQKLAIASDFSFRDARILAQFTINSELIIVVKEALCQHLYIALPYSRRCGALSSNGRIVKVLGISPDGKYLAWCELKSPDSLYQICVCNIEEELTSSPVSCSLEDVA